MLSERQLAPSLYRRNGVMTNRQNREPTSFEPINLNFEKMNGLVPCILQHAYSGEVLMVGFMNEEAWTQTCESGIFTIYRRTLGRVWKLNEDEEFFFHVVRIRVDCDDDTVICETVPEHPVCGKGYYSCFYKEVPTKLKNPH